MARVSCASLLIEPYDMAPVLKRLDDGFDRLDLVDRHWRLRDGLNSMSPRRVSQILRLIVDELGELLVGIVAFAAHRLLQFVDGFRAEEVVLTVGAVLVFAAGIQARTAHRPTWVALTWRRRASSAITSRPMPPMRDARPGEVADRPRPGSGRWPRRPGRRGSSARSRCPSWRCTLTTPLITGLDVVLARLSRVWP